MGYDVHITRAELWAENEGHWITAEEWLRVVEEDEELQLDPHPSNGPYMAIWNGPSENSEPWLDWADGNVFTKNPDAPLLAKMIELAGKLKAKVQGDDGEIYDAQDMQQEGGNKSGRTTTRFSDKWRLYASRIFFIFFIIAAIAFGFRFIYMAYDLYDRNVAGTIFFGLFGIFFLVSGIFCGWAMRFVWKR